MGLAYKPDVDDMRESPTFKIMDLLDEYNAEIDFYDPYIDIVKPTREHANWTGKGTIAWEKSLIESYDAVIISTNHSDINYKQLAEWCNCIIDTRNAMKGITPMNDIYIWKA